MKRSKKITIGIILFFVIITVIIVGRYSMGLYFEKKFSKRPPPGIIVEVVTNKNFSQTLESYCTSLSSKTTSFKIKKNELLEPINFNTKVNKGDILAKLSNKTITAPFSGVIGKRGISGSSLGGENTIILTLDDSRRILCDLTIPETYAAILKKGLKLNATFSAYKDKTYSGTIELVASRVDAQTRSILARAKINNENLEILPGSLLEIEILYNEKNALSIPDTALIMEGNKKFVYQVIENNMIKKTEIETGVRDQENLEVLDGLTQGDKVVAEGLTKVRPNMKIKPIIKSQ
ncbi:MAG: efflux RND transporter periplasmic adaptor subunit [Alphaproteobacteria bacterium]|jgi:membrane fusion protein (multidrug efflux system)|nr:MAG: efflux RND transporter periplasmic adaptor subunit [Alphaproteobacteria bacterium]